MTWNITDPNSKAPGYGNGWCSSAYPSRPVPPEPLPWNKRKAKRTHYCERGCTRCGYSDGPTNKDPGTTKDGET